MIAGNFKHGFVAFILIILQSTLMHLASVEGVTPDLLTIWIVYLALTKGQMYATTWGFAIGLVFDLATGSFIGLSALTKTLAGFIAGYFFNETQTKLVLGSYRFLLIVLLTSFIQDTAYFVVFTRGTDIDLIQATVQFGLATTLYTGTVSLIPILKFSRQLLT